MGGWLLARVYRFAFRRGYELGLVEGRRTVPHPTYYGRDVFQK